MHGLHLQLILINQLHYGSLIKDCNLLIINKLHLRLSEKCLKSFIGKELGTTSLQLAYLWNNWFDESFTIEENFLSRLYWHSFHKEIEFYNDMLIIERQLEHLQKTFSDIEFRFAFLTHYEVAISLLNNPHYVITKMNEFVPLMNYVNGLNRTYGDGAFFDLK